MSKVHDLLRNADECQRMSASSRDNKEREEWLKLAEAWLALVRLWEAKSGQSVMTADRPKADGHVHSSFYH